MPIAVAPGVDDQRPCPQLTQVLPEVAPRPEDQEPRAQLLHKKAAVLDDQVPAGQVKHVLAAFAPATEL